MEKGERGGLLFFDPAERSGWGDGRAPEAGLGERARGGGVGSVFRGRRSVWPFRADERRPASPPRLFRLS